MTVMRRYTFALYMTPSQEAAVREQARLLAQLRNAFIELIDNTYRCRREAAGLPSFGGAMRRREPTWHQPSRPWSEERKAAARARRSPKADKPTKSRAFEKPLILSFNDLTAEITALRHACPEYEALSVFSEHRVAKSLTLAYAAAFRKRAAGEAVEFPRFRRTDKATQVPFGSSGWKLSPAGCERSRGAQKRSSARTWRLRLHGIAGTIRTRGELPAEVLAWKTADVIFRHGRWELSVCVEMAPRRVAGDENLTVKFDLIDEFARVERAEGRRSACEVGARTHAQNPYHLNIMVGGSDHPDNAGAGERVGREFGFGACDLADHPDNAGAGERGGREFGFGACDLADHPDNAGAGERGDGGGGVGPNNVADHPDNAGAGERGSRRHGRQQVEGPDHPDNAGAGERGLSNSGGEHPQLGPDHPDNAGAGERGVGNGRADHPDNAGAGERGCWEWTGERETIDAFKSDRDRRYRKRSWRWRQATRRIGRIERRDMRRRQNDLHAYTNKIIRRASDLTVIIPAVKELTATPRGNERSWGACVAIVSKLNRHVLGQSPTAAAAMLRYKAEETGIRCDLIEDHAPNIAVGKKLVAAGKAVRTAKRAMRR